MPQSYRPYLQESMPAVLALTSPSQMFGVEIIGQPCDYTEELQRAAYAALYMSARFLRDRTGSGLSDFELVCRTQETFATATKPIMPSRRWASHLAAPLRPRCASEIHILKEAAGHIPLLVRELAHHCVFVPDQSNRRLQSHDTKAFGHLVTIASHRVIGIAGHTGVRIQIMQRPRTSTQKYSLS